MYNRIALCVALCALAGCASTPQRFFTLDMAPSAQRTGVNIEIQHIRVADPLLGKQLLIRKSPTELEYYAVGQWASQLDELLTEKFYAEFGPRTAGTPALHLSGWLQAFEQIDLPGGGAEAHIKLTLVFRDPVRSRTEPPLLEKTYELRAPAPAAEAAAVAETLSRGVEALAEQIVNDARSL
ncbi:MAG: membrane integrity-associated transporter subunit PqiC [Candidatus Hydrogenedentes bacterium]|nr:membrane integrity-associated transporter subunit PqiC [Candidatus Hydrogenedentota bacterium]